MTLTIDDLTRIARETIGDHRITLTPEMAAVDVPGWDSLNHTLITLEIGADQGLEIEPRTLAKAVNFAELIVIVNGMSGDA